MKVFKAMALVKSHRFSVWSDEAEIALSPSGVMASQTSPDCLPSVLSSLSARSTRRHRSEAAVTALLIGRRGFLKVVVQLTEGGRRIQTAITAALDATDGNVRKVQKLSRHRKLDTLMIYDDNRGRDQRDVTDLLDGMF